MLKMKIFWGDDLKYIMNSIENKLNNSARLDSETANELLRDLVELDK
jgi:hypothetical protein